MAANIKTLSLRLYDILEAIGASENMRKFHRRSARTVEILRTLETVYLSGVPTRSYSCGSFYEGSTTPDLRSDRDTVSCFDIPPIVLTQADAPDGVSRLMVESNYPGYVKLRCMLNRRVLTLTDVDSLRGYEIDRSGYFCAQHIFCKGTEAVLTGPAAAYSDEAGNHHFDEVLAFRCSSVPAFASEWITRQRNHEWPSKDEIDDLRRMGCMVVGVGNVHSSEEHLEWRLSFSLQERQLMASLNPVQHKVYILLKVVKKDLIEGCMDESPLSSYHCKTCVLYAAETTPADIWTSDNLIECLLLCLKALLDGLLSGNFSNYFVKKQNLFAKEVFRTKKESLAGILQGLCQEGHHFLYRLQCDRIGELLQTHSSPSVNMTQRSLKLFKYKNKFKIQLVTLALGCCHALVKKFGSNGLSVKALLEILEHLYNSGCITEHSTEETQAALALVLPWIQRHVALSMASLAYQTPGMSKNQRQLIAMKFHLSKARKADVIGTMLAKATVLLKLEKYGLCQTLLQKVCTEIIPTTWSVCYCRSNLNTRAKVPDDVHMRWGEMTVESLARIGIAPCITFLPSEKEIVPFPLRYEMQRSSYTPAGSRDEGIHFWYDWAVVDVKVYIQFLLYMVSSKLCKPVEKNGAIDTLRDIIHTDPNIQHKDTAYNLLGWIYIQEQSTEKGLNCFTDSLEIQPLHNAAKLHIEDVVA